MEVLLDGLAKGALCPKLTIGVIILLIKRGDQLLVENRRGLTLLNRALKILSKKIQLRLSQVLHGFITEHQHGFLPGRSIHRAVMLLDKILHKAKATRKDFILFKLDTIKAFDYMNWLFLLRLLERIGVGPNFRRMIVATYSMASSVVLIQGKLSAPFLLKRSTRQGCPLSPILFILVANALSWMFIRAS